MAHQRTDTLWDHESLAGGANTDRTAKILRFTGAERAMHWAIALPFMVCLATAAVLFFYYNPNPQRPYRAIFSWIHRGSGIALVVAPLLVLAVCWRSFRVHLKNMKEGWLWSLAEVKWLLLMPLSVIFKRISLPEEGKFNAAEKLNFMMVTVACPVLAATGLMIWLTKTPFIPWMIHLGVTALVLPLVFGHKFMAIVNPGTRIGLSGMFSGRVNRDWAKHHYRRWFRENFEQTEQVPERIEQPLPAIAPAVATTAAKTPPQMSAGWPTSGQTLFESACDELRAGRQTEALRLGQEAVSVCIATGDLTCAARIFQKMGRGNKLRLRREELLVVGAELLAQKNITWAIHAYGLVLRQGEDEAAVEALLRIAELERERGAAIDAMKIYNFLVQHAPSHSARIRNKVKKIIKIAASSDATSRVAVSRVAAA